MQDVGTPHVPAGSRQYTSRLVPNGLRLSLTTSRPATYDAGMVQSTNEIGGRGYVVPQALVSTDWVAEHLEDPDVRIVESNEDPLLYSSGHVPGAVEVDWTRDLNDPIRRDYLMRDGFEQLMSRIGATRET